MSQVSVIIPVYNTEKYLRRCLESLLYQTHRDWEAVCIDDGSTDGSSAILNEYTEKDKRFLVKHIQNSGVSEARNTALQIASGEFCTFMDSDDFLHPQALEIACNMALRNKSFLVAYTYDRSYRTRTIIRHAIHIKETENPHFRHYDLSKINYLKVNDLFEYATEYSSAENGAKDKKWAVKHCQPWRCLYRTESIKEIKFIRGIIYEDFPWWGEVLVRACKDATILNLPLYFYYPNKRSYILSSKQEYRIESLKKAVSAAEELKGKMQEERQRELWEKFFLQPFRLKLEHKLRRAH